MNIVRVNIGFFAGFKKIKQRRISFVLVYLRTILWKNPTAISIKHRILATFNIKKIFNSFYLPLNMTNKYERWMGVQEMQLYIYIEIIYQNKLKKQQQKNRKELATYYSRSDTGNSSKTYSIVTNVYCHNCQYYSFNVAVRFFFVDKTKCCG
jgi:hypothetical protein